MIQKDRDRANSALSELFSIINGNTADNDPRSRFKRRALLYKSAQKMQSFQRLKQSVLGPMLSSEPCWEILVALYIAWSQEIKISVTDLSHETQIPAATVVRWVAALEKNILIHKQADKRDGRRTWVSLSKKGLEKIEQCLSVEAFGRIELTDTNLDLIRSRP